MVTTVSSIHIKQPLKVVYDFITDPRNAPVWHASIIEIDGKAGMPLGSTGTMIAQVMGHKVTSHYLVTENDGERVTQARSSQGPLQFETTQMLEEVTATETSLTIRTSIDAGAIFRLAEPALESVMITQMDADLRMLKSMLEQGAGGAKPD